MIIVTTDTYMLITTVAVSIIALFTDLRSRRIPNALTLPVITLGLAYHLVIGGPPMLLQSAEGMMLGLGLFMIPYFMGGMGAGDAKLMGALGALAGPWAIANIALFTALAGGIYALGIIIMRRESKHYIMGGLASLWVLAATRNLSLISMPRKEAMPRLCYAVAIASGTVFYMVLALSGHNMIF
jgi:prepilin peptidase CpaA